MPKYKKKKKTKIQRYEEKQEELAVLKRKMFSTSIKSLVIGGIILVFSFLLNGNLILGELESGTALDVLFIFIKSLLIIFFFGFVLIGVANTMELKGNPASIREIILIMIISLIQSVRNVSVFWISLAGILLFTLYIWSVQTKVETI